MRFIDLFAGLGGFRLALESPDHECVFASEADTQLRDLYEKNFPAGPAISGDIRLSKSDVPEHDLLCAGFPCQPFSKSGSQEGLKDQTRGTLFHEILEILKEHRPKFVILENVGNFERHDGGRTWKVVKSSLEKLGYETRGTEHLASGGDGLLSPHHLGHPHHRERFFAVASLQGFARDPFPPRNRKGPTEMEPIVQRRHELSERDREETKIVDQHRRCIEHWNSLLDVLPEEEVDLPSFPIWGDEIGAEYTFEDSTPWASTLAETKGVYSSNGHFPAWEAFKELPSYARTRDSAFPDWKINFIKANRDWFGEIEDRIPTGWTEELGRFPPCLRKLEWNCKGEERNLWNHILQFRPSGLRVKRYRSSPSLVAMTSTQIPILGPEQRHLSRVEGLRLQGFPDDFQLPDSRTAAFKALGNAVHVDVVRKIAERISLTEDPSLSATTCLDSAESGLVSSNAACPRSSRRSVRVA